MSNPSRAAALLEITAMVALVLSYIWGWEGTFPGNLLVVVALYFALGVMSHWRRGESARTLGLRWDNWTAAARNAYGPVAVGVCVPLALGALLGSWHFEPGRSLLLTVPWLVTWGTAQQYGLLCFLYRRFLDVLAGPWEATLAAAILFAVFHLPNPLLVGVTFIAGLVSCTLYRRVPNVFVLGIGHAAISFTLFAALPFRLTHHLRVGPGYFVSALVLCCMLIQHASAEANDELAQYVGAPDDSYGWREIHAGRISSVEYVEAILTSQTWRGIPWKHQLIVLRPRQIDWSAEQAFLFIDGGHWDPQYETGPAPEPARDAHVFIRLANALHAPLAIVRQVPFEPLFDRREDALIAYSFEQYFNTGEADWPLLLPMVKSAAKAMDAVQQLARQRWGIPISRFTVAGASKRGWTSWLTAAVDPRVASVAPMVIDMLNIPAQIQLQRQTFGGLSEEIHDYEEIHLPERIDSAPGRALVSMVDPYSYRDRLTKPKLILLGTNDPYWPLDALKLYWNGLPEEKRVLYLPNQTHSLRDFDRLLGSLSALYRYSAHGRSLPQISGKFARQDNELELEVRTDQRPRRVLAWSTTSPTRDFRKAHWTSHPCDRAKDVYRCRARTASDHYTALYAEVAFEDHSEPGFSLSTNVCIAGGPDSDSPGC